MWPWATSTTMAGPISSSPAGALYVLLRNRGDGRFDDVTLQAGLAGRS